MSRFRKHTVPTKGPRLVQLLFVNMNLQEYSIKDLAKKAGVSPYTIKNWRQNQYAPMLAPLEACYGALGLELAPHYVGEGSND